MEQLTEHRPVRLCLIVTLMAASLLMSAGVSTAASDWTAPASASAKKNPLIDSGTSVTAGRHVFIRECASCHGRSGKGDGTRAKELAKPPGDLTSSDVAGESDGALFWKVTTGKEPMSSYEKTLTDQQRWEVVSYIRTLGGSRTASHDKQTTDSK